MKTLLPILLLGFVLAALYVLYLRREGPRRMAQGKPPMLINLAGGRVMSGVRWLVLAG
jgi:hypothetical protein